MSLFDTLKRAALSALKREARKAVDNAVSNIGKGRNYTEKFTFTALPANVEELKALPEAKLDTAFKTAALTVLALSRYETDPEAAFEMLAFLKGPEALTNSEKSFIKDRFYEVDYVPRSYFNGSTPENDYNPPEPYTITVFDGPYSYQNEGYAKLFIRSGGADNPREVLLRMTKDGKWYLWDQFLLPSIREPHGANPWA